MRLADAERDLPILLVHYERVLKRLERTAKGTMPPKVSRRAVLDDFLKTRSFVRTAKKFGVSPATVNNILVRAFRIARKIARLKPDWAAGDH